ncbi:MAG: UpxY family transcription antiterminator [Prevotellaceae bacterium]|jgi:transcription antitermination factor NusG|nr:UpxY family transcription antiterminator [Prevotellaceae bacterium]
MNKSRPNEEKWYVLYTAPRAEKQVAQRLKKESISTFLPLHLSPRRWSDRIKLIEIPLFSSYIFIHTMESLLHRTIVLQGVSHVVYYDGKPAVVRESEIAAIRQFLEQARAKELNYQPDEKVLIACGPLKNISGKIKKVGKTHIVLHLEQIGLTVTVAADQIKKIQKDKNI